MTKATENIVAQLKALPPGRVASYGAVAAAAGLRGGARSVVRVLHSMGDSEGLPWHRVVRADGRIALPRGGGFELQRSLLEAEGVPVSEEGRVDMAVFSAFDRAGSAR